jgi:hypothetical protein
MRRGSMINKLAPLCAKRGNVLILEKLFELETKVSLTPNRTGRSRAEGNLFKKESKTKLLSETFRQACGLTSRKGFKFDPHKKASNNTLAVKCVTGTVEFASSLNKLKEKMMRSSKSLKEKNKGSFKLSRLKRALEKTVMKRIRTSKMSDILSRTISNQLKNGVKSGKVSTVEQKSSGKEVLIQPQFTEEQLIEKANSALPVFNNKKDNPKLPIKPGQVDYNSLNIHRQSSVNSKHGMGKRVQKQTTVSKFKSTTNPTEANASPAIQLESDELSAQTPKKEINLLDKLRNTARSAYSIGSLYNFSSIFFN